MNIWVWIAIFAGWTLFTAWVLFWGGADWLEENWLVAFLIDWLSASLAAEQIKLYFLIVWILYLCFFTFGLFFPDSRFLWLAA